jgi:hypothetical protein
MTCNHQPRHVSGPGWEAWLSANGNWWTLKRTAAGLEAIGIQACPGCGVKLWGLP